MKYKPKRDLVKFALEAHTVSPTDLAQIVLKKRNKEITPEAVTMWFNRHPEIYEEILKSIHKEELPKLEVSPSIFRNGTFEELPSVKNWIQEMKDRRLRESEIQGRVSCLKRVCKDYGIPKEEKVFKHPDRLTLDEARNYIRARMEDGLTMHGVRIALRDFFPSKGITVGKKISGAKQSGKYSRLYVPVEVVREFLNGIKALNYEAYTVCLFILHTGTRITATIEALIEEINDKESYITVYDKGRKSKYPKGHPWEKHLSPELREALETVIGDRVEGNIFSISSEEIRNLNKAVLKDLLKKYHNERAIIRQIKLALNMPTHWLRHQFFQHCLHETDWEYGVCASLGGSTVSSLEESYGKPPKAIVKKWGKEWLNKITM